MSMVEVKTADLIGPALDWAVSIAEGQEIELCGDRPHAKIGRRIEGRYQPSTSWSQGGPLIAKYSISLNHYCIGGRDEDGDLRDALVACIGYRRTISGKNAEVRAPSGEYLLGACRAIVAAKLGDTVQVPEELMP